MHGTATADPADGLQRDADGKIGEPVGVEVPCCQNEAELVIIFGLVRDAWAVLGPDLPTLLPQPGLGAVEDVDDARIPFPGNRAPRRTDRQIADAVTVRVGGQTRT